MNNQKELPDNKTALWTRRNFLKIAAAAGITAAGGLTIGKIATRREEKTRAFIASVSGYGAGIKEVILAGIRELGINADAIKGKRILLKPNLVEPHRHLEHINTHPLFIRGAAEAFLSLGASEVYVAEGSGHRRDSLLVLEESGLGDVLYEDRIPFIDLNESSVIRIENSGRTSKLQHFMIPQEIKRADMIVSLAKMKTHHWAGVTLSMKNLFGLMPGNVYGWPKNVLHWAGINECIYDINATVKPQIGIVDGIVGMEGDGPIMGDPVSANVIVMGTNLPAVDATCARIMGVNPYNIAYLKYASGRIGSINEGNIEQRGENIIAVRKDFKLLDNIPAHRGLRLSQL